MKIRSVRVFPDVSNYLLAYEIAIKVGIYENMIAPSFPDKPGSSRYDWLMMNRILFFNRPKLISSSKAPMKVNLQIKLIANCTPNMLNHITPIQKMLSGFIIHITNGTKFVKTHIQMMKIILCFEFAMHNEVK